MFVEVCTALITYLFTLELFNPKLCNVDIKDLSFFILLTSLKVDDTPLKDEDINEIISDHPSPQGVTTNQRERYYISSCYNCL